jgi:hypothetical protein
VEEGDGKYQSTVISFGGPILVIVQPQVDVLGPRNADAGFPLACYANLDPINFSKCEIGGQASSGTLFRLLLRLLMSKCTVDRPQIGYPPDRDKSIALRTCSVSGKEFGCMKARPSPQNSITLRTCPI